MLGRLSDLDEALTFHRDALRLRPEGHPDRPSSLNNLANCLLSRFGQLVRLSDLDEALDIHRHVLELRPHGHPHRDTSFNNAAYCLQARFKALRDLSDLDEAIAFHRNALELRSHGHPHRRASLNNLGNCLHSRFLNLRELPDLNEALAFHREALQLLPQGHPDRSSSLSNLATCLYSCFEQHGRLSDLEDALTFGHDALELRPQGHPARSTSLTQIAMFLHARFKGTGADNVDALQEIFSLYSQISDIDSSRVVSPDDLKCVKKWIWTAEEYGHSTTISAYQTFLRICVQYLATVPGLPQQLAVLKKHVESISVDAFSACLRHGNPTIAVELLEQGRGVFWTQLIRLRSPLDEVISSGDAGRELGTKFMQLATRFRMLLQTNSSDSDVDTLHDQASSLGIQMQDVISEIHQLPGFSRFLLPPLFSDLRIAAAEGPVIIVNASQYTCDALIIMSDQQPIHVPLPIDKSRVIELSDELHYLTSRLAKTEDVTKDLRNLLIELWDSIVSPIMEVLRDHFPPLSRVWWCPTAEFSLLPLHAAECNGVCGYALHHVVCTWDQYGVTCS